MQVWSGEMSATLLELATFQVEIAADTAKEHSQKCRRVFDEIQDKKSEIEVLGDMYKNLIGDAGRHFTSLLNVRVLFEI